MTTKKLTRESFLSKEALKTKSIFVEELGGEVTIRQLSVKQFRELKKQIDDAQQGKDDTEFLKLGLLAFVNAAVDDDGKRLFADEDVEALAESLPLAVVSYIAEQSISATKLDKLKSSQEEVEKN